MRENEKEVNRESGLCFGYCVDGGVVIDRREFRFGFVEFVVLEEYLGEDV